MSELAPSPPHRRGAHRSETARVAILEATARLFAERGYEHLSIEGIAAAAKVGKQTIYRWWPTKSDLVADCLLQGLLIPARLSIPDSGDLAADLEEWLLRVFAVIETPSGRGVLVSLIAAATSNDQIGARLRDSLGADESLEERMRAGIAAGQLGPDALVEELSEALVGAVILKALSGRPIVDADAARLVRALVPSPRH